jgi:4-amino-4-deoxy-L-arabinose transferase-like glycosyltransferase/tetratricopeptide (TPR) repeat protein
MALALKERLRSIPPLAWLLVLVVACLVPFVDKAFHIDDILFLRAAEQIRQNPVDFFGFKMNWYGTAKPMIDNFDNPPLACYYLAVVSSIVGWSETALHLSFLLPALAAVCGVYFLAKQLGARPLMATAAAVLSPVFIISATTLMCDVMLLAFWVWAVFFFETGLGRARGAREKFLISGCLAGLAFLTKLTGVALVPLLVAYGLIRTRRLGYWVLAPTLALLFAVGYEVITFQLYGKGLLFTAASVSAHSSTRAGSFFAKQVAGLTYLGGCYLPVLLLASSLWSGRAIGLGLLLSSPVIVLFPYCGSFSLLWDLDGKTNWALCAQSVLFILSGTHIVFLAAHDLWKHRSPASILLLLWTGGIFAFATVFNWTVNGRSLLPMLPAVGVLVGRQLALRASQAKPQSNWALGFPLLPATAISLLLAVADFQLAGSGRTAAFDACRLYQRPGSRLWFGGHWGFQYYMEKQGAKPLDTSRPLERGDLVVVASEGVNLVDMPEDQVTLVDTLEYRRRLPWATFSVSAGAGFYAAHLGPFPFSIGLINPERYYVFQVTRTSVSGDNSPLGSIENRAVVKQFLLERRVMQCEHALRRNPHDTAVRLELAALAQTQQRRAEAIRQYRRVLGEKPDSAAALQGLAWMLATDRDNCIRNGAEAVKLATRADRLTRHEDPAVLFSLGAAYAELGQFEKATAATEEALKLTQAGNQVETASLCEFLLAHFRQNRPFHQFSDLFRQEKALAAAADKPNS